MRDAPVSMQASCIHGSFLAVCSSKKSQPYQCSILDSLDSRAAEIRASVQNRRLSETQGREQMLKEPDDALDDITDTWAEGHAAELARQAQGTERHSETTPEKETEIKKLPAKCPR
jgi:hypothetical protein